MAKSERYNFVESVSSDWIFVSVMEDGLPIRPQFESPVSSAGFYRGKSHRAKYHRFTILYRFRSLFIVLSMIGHFANHYRIHCYRSHHH